MAGRFSPGFGPGYQSQGTPSAPVLQPQPFDLPTAMLACAPGIVLTHDMESDLLLAYQAGGYVALTCAQIVAIVVPDVARDNLLGATPQLAGVPALPKGMRRFADSNPSPRDGWAIDNERGNLPR